MARFFIRTVGIDKAIARFEYMKRELIDAEELMIPLVEYMFEAIKLNFESEGYRIGHPWHPLSDTWEEYKYRHGLDPRMGIATRRLFDAYTQPGDSHQIIRMDPHSVEIGSDVEYQAQQEWHRPFAQFNNEDAVWMANRVTQGLIDAWSLGKE